MSRQYEVTKRRTIDFAARFGFVTKSLFNNHLSNFGNTQNFRFWNRLLTQRFLVTARTSKDIAYISAKARALKHGSAVPARSPFMIPHDIIVAEFILSLEKSELVKGYWTEHDLKSDIGLACTVMGSDRVMKYPDIVVEMKAINDGSIRVAIEIERSQKSHSRYASIANGYLKAKNIDLLIFGIETVTTRKAILGAFADEIFVKASKILATFLLPDFESSNFLAEAQILNYRMPLKKMLIGACRLKESDWSTSGISIPDSFQFEKSRKDKIA